MEKEGKLFSNTLLLSFASMLSKTITFLMLPLYTAAMDPAEFGVADILVSTAVLLLPIVSLHAPEAVFRFRVKGEQGTLWAGMTALFLGLCAFALCLPFLALSSVLRPYVWLLYFYVAASLCRSFLAHVLRADGAFSLYAIQQVFCTLLTVLLQVLFLRIWQRGVAGYLTAVILADALTFATLIPLLLARLRCEKRPVRPLRRQMLRYALPMIPGTVLWWVTSVSDRYLVLLYCGEAATGIYAAAGRLPGLVTLAIGIFMEAWHYAALRAEKGSEGALFGRIYALLLPVLLAMGVGVILLARPIVMLVLARDFESAATLVPLLVFGALCGGLSHFLCSIYTLRMRSGAALLTGAAPALLNILLNLFLVPRLGVLGAALSTALSFAISLAIRLLHTRQLLPFARYGNRLLLSLCFLFAAAVMMAGGAYVVGMLIAPLSLVPFLAQSMEAIRFMRRRGMAFWQDLKKRGNYRKKV